MKAPSNELLLALRAPTSGWLAAIVCALDEALQDPAFDANHRQLLQQLLLAEFVPGAVAEAAADRLARFEASINEAHRQLVEISTQELSPSAPQRPKLTLCGTAAA
jgi:hypothetical protein